MNILLIGEEYSDNLGDGVIFQAVKETLQKKKHNIVDLDISGRVNFSQVKTANRTDLYCKVKNRIRKVVSLRTIGEFKRIMRLRKRLNELQEKKIDLIVFAGGQLFLGYFIKPIQLISRYAKKKNIKIIYNSIGFGEMTDAQKRVLKKLLEDDSVIRVSVRDNYEMARVIVPANKIDYCLDPVLSLRGEGGSSRLIGIGIMNPATFDSDYEVTLYADLLKIAIQSITDNGYEYELFTNGSKDDEYFVRQLVKIVGIHSAPIHKSPTTPIELIKLLDRYKTIISFRMHSHIIMTSRNKRTIGFIWDKKIEDFSKIINNEKMFIRINRSSIKELPLLISELLKDTELPCDWRHNKKTSEMFLGEVIDVLDKDKK